MGEPLPTGNQLQGTTGAGEPASWSFYPTPGLRRLATLPQGRVRGIWQATTGGVYAVAGTGVYRLHTNDWSSTLLGSITPGIIRPVGMADNGLQLVIVDGSPNGWTITLADDTFAEITEPAFYGADRAAFLDTYLLFNKPGTPQFYASDSLATTFDPLYFADKESFSDELISLAVAKREIWLLGSKTTEVWFNSGGQVLATGGTDFPFQEQGGTFVDMGCAAVHSVATHANAVYWLGRDRNGQGVVMRGIDYAGTRISTFPIEHVIAGYAASARIDDAIGFIYQLGGHAVYVLTFPHADATWAFDITTGQWHEWRWIDDNGEEHRHRANCCAAIDGVPIVGDWQNGNVYALDRAVFTDDGQPIKRERAFPHILNDGNRVFYHRFIADIETGTEPGTAQPDQTLEYTSFTAANGTLLSAYANPADTNPNWALVSGTEAEITGNRLAGPSGGGVSLYQSDPLPTADYTLQFRAIPTNYAGVGTASAFVIARSAATGTGYRAMVAGDGTQYWLTLGVEGSASTILAMGTIASGQYIVTMGLEGPRITLSAQRTSDGRYLHADGTWLRAPGPAMTLTDATYAGPGRIMLGGDWPSAPPALAYTMETPLVSDPNFPSGWSYQDADGGQAFDFGRNLYYHAISGTVSGSGVGGIAITDLNSMGAVRTVTLAQMYAGTPYGQPAGSPPSQSIFGVVSGKNTDLYILMDNALGHGVPGEYCRFTRVDPVTMKVTGEFYSSASFPPPITCVLPGGWQGGMINTTASHTIVLYPINGSRNTGPELFDGTGMAPIGLGPTPMDAAYNCMFCAGKKHPDGSCDFIMMDPDSWLHPTSGNIDIWKINVSDSLVITSTKTGTLNVLPYFTPPATTDRLFVGQLEYDPVNDALIVTIPDASAGATAPNGTPSWLLSVNYDGAVNWSQYQATIGGSVYSNAQSDLSGGTYMAGASNNLHLYDTATGDVIFTGSILVGGSSANSFFNVWDSTRFAYWTYALSRGFVRIDLRYPASLAIDDVLATAPAERHPCMISLEWSNDRGHSWSNPVSQPMGATGQYGKTLTWQRLGMARDRVWKLQWSCPSATALQGAWIEVSAEGKGQG